MALLDCESGRRCVSIKNGEGKLPIECVDNAKSSASAAKAKKIKKLLQEQEQREKQEQKQRRRRRRRRRQGRRQEGRGERRGGVQAAAGGAAAQSGDGAAAAAADAPPPPPRTAEEAARERAAELRAKIVATAFGLAPREVVLAMLKEAKPAPSVERRASAEAALKAEAKEAKDEAAPPAAPVDAAAEAARRRRGGAGRRCGEAAPAEEAAAAPRSPPARGRPRGGARGGKRVGRGGRRRGGVDGLFDGLAWVVLIVRPAARELSALDPHDKEAALRKLCDLAAGIWSGHDMKHLTEGVPDNLSLYEIKFSKGARIVWTIGVDFVPSVGMYSQTIRVWAVHRRHDDAAKSIRRVCAIHARGRHSVISRKLRTSVRAHRVAGTEHVLPKRYDVAPDEVAAPEFEELEAALGETTAAADGGDGGEGEEDGVERLTRYPPAVEQEDAFNLVKFYALDRPRRLDPPRHHLREARVPFRTRRDRAPRHLSGGAALRPLIGRSGTGKTTIVVQRMWLKFRTAYQKREAFRLAAAAAPAAAPPAADGGEAAVVEAAAAPEPPAVHQLFVTANPILRNSVAKASTRCARDSSSPTAATATRRRRRRRRRRRAAARRSARSTTWARVVAALLRAHHGYASSTIRPEGRRFFTAEERAAAAAAGSGGTPRRAASMRCPSSPMARRRRRR